MLLWSAVLAWAHGVVLVLGAAFAAFAVLLIVTDRRDRDGDLDGLASAVGVAGLVVIAPVLLLAGVLLVFVLRGRRRLVRRDVTGPLRRAAVASVVPSTVVLVASVFGSLALTGSQGLLVAEVVVVPCLAILVPALAVVVTARAAPALLTDR